MQGRWFYVRINTFIVIFWHLTGGVDIAAEWAGFETVGQCEFADYPYKILEKHWPDVSKWRDIRDLTIDSFANQLYNNLDIIIQEEFEMSIKSNRYDGAKDMYDAGMSIGECALFYEISRQAMWKILQRRGVEFRPQQRIGEENHFYRGTKAEDKCHNIVEKAIARGKIKRKSCEVCGNNSKFADGRSAIQAHHDDYNRPMSIRWLCQKCHYKWHEENKAKEVVPHDSRSQSADDYEPVTVISGGFP